MSFVNWYEAKGFINWFAQLTNKSFELLSEAQSAYLIHNSNHTYHSGDSAYRVQQYLPDNLGLQNIHGNVSEWTADCAHHNYNEAPKNDRPWLNVAPCKFAVARGASYFSNKQNQRINNRLPLSKKSRLPTVGFRIALRIIKK